MVDLVRRGILKGAGAVGAALGLEAFEMVAGIPAAQAQGAKKTAEPDFLMPRTVTRGSHEAFGNALKATSRAHEGRNKPGTICFGVRDLNHLEAVHKDPLLDSGNQDIAKATGYGVLSIELPAKCQDIANKLWQSAGTEYDLTVFKGQFFQWLREEIVNFDKTGKINPDDLKIDGLTVADIHNWGSVIIAAKKARIPLYLNDTQPMEEMIQNMLDMHTLLKNPSDEAAKIRVAKNWEKRVSIYDPEAASRIKEQMDFHKTNAIHFGGDLHFRLRSGDTFAHTGLPVRNVDDSLRQMGVTTPTLLMITSGDPKTYYEGNTYLKEHQTSPFPPHPSQMPDFYYSAGAAALHTVDPIKYPAPQTANPKAGRSFQPESGPR